MATLRGILAVHLTILIIAACGAAPRKASYYSPPAASYGGSSGGGAAGEAVTVSAQSEGRFLARAEADDDGGAVAQAGPPAPPASQVAAGTPPKEMLVIEGWLQIMVDDVRAAAASVRKQVEEAGGRVIVEDVSGSKDAVYGNLQVRIPPDRTAQFLEFIDKLGEVQARRIQATDVSREYFDREIQLQNLRLAMNRLQALLDRPGLDMAQILQIEQEITRRRGEIERLEGEQRFLRDRVSFATVNISLTRRRGAVFAPEAKFHPGPRAAGLYLLDSDFSEQTRVGAGATLHFARHFTLDLDIFADPTDGDGDATTTAFVSTLGGAAYSDFLGHGERRFLNPFMGLRVGYGYLDSESYFVAGAEVGLELFKTRWLLVETAVRALALVGESSTAALHGYVGFEFPF